MDGIAKRNVATQPLELPSCVGLVVCPSPRTHLAFLFERLLVVGRPAGSASRITFNVRRPPSLVPLTHYYNLFSHT